MPFSIDDVRESFTADLTNFLSQVEVAARAAVEPRALLTESTGSAGPHPFDVIGQNGHSIGGTSKLVGASSLAASAALLEELASDGLSATRMCLLFAARARRCSDLCLEGAVAMRSMLELELEHRSVDAGWIQTEWAERVTELRPRPSAGEVEALGSPASQDQSGEAEAPGARSTRSAREFVFDEMDEGWSGDGVQAVAPASDESMTGELKGYFEQEARESRVALDGHLQALAVEPASRTVAAHIERIYHTLKGASATVGLKEVSDLAKELQIRMELVLDEGEAITPEFLDRLLGDTNRLLAAAGVPELRVSAARSPAEAQDSASTGARASFLVEAKRACDDAMEHVRQLADGPRGAKGGLEMIRRDLSGLFHRLKGSALVVGDDVAGRKARELQILCLEGELSAAVLEHKLRDLAAHLEIELAPERDRSPRIVPRPAEVPAIEVVHIPDAEIWDAFVQECGELLDEIEKLALDLERSAEPKRLLLSALRVIHTLKGAVNTVGLGSTGHALHAAEDLLTALVERPILPALRDVAGCLLDVQTQVRRNLGQAPTGQIEVWLERVETWAGQVGAGQSSLDDSRRADASASDLEGSDSRSASAGASHGRSGSQGGISAPAVERRYIRVPAERLDSLMNLVGELVVSRSRLLSRVGVLRSMQLDLGRSRTRLVDTVNRFCEQYEFANLGGQPLVSRSAVLAAGRTPSAAATSTHKRSNGNGAALARSPAPEPMGELAVFSELELDRYEDVHILSRSLSEIQDDVHEVDVDLLRELTDFASDAESFGGIVSNIQGEITRARMVSLESLFTRLRLPIRDAADKSRKDVVLVTEGEDVTLDKTIADALFTPMLHLVRNAVAHGIESPGRRQAAGKRGEGRVILSARQESGQIVIEIRDDGQGLDLAALHGRAVAMGLIAAHTALDDPTIKDLVFAAGLSTQATAGMVSGRGIGCDVVRRSIERMNGDVAVTTRPGIGTTFILTLPVTLAITRAILVRHGQSSYAFPMYFADRIVETDEQAVVESAGYRRLQIDDSLVPLRRLEELFGRHRQGSGGPIILLRVGDQSVAVQVDAVVGQAEIVVKRLGDILDGHPLFGGMTIRGTGELSLIVDVPGLVEAVAGKAAVRQRPGIELQRREPAAVEHRAGPSAIRSHDDRSLGGPQGAPGLSAIESRDDRSLGGALGGAPGLSAFESRDDRSLGGRSNLGSQEVRPLAGPAVADAAGLKVGMAVPPRPAASSAGPARRVRVLFVDDSLSVRKVAERVLAGLGADVTVAMDGVDALSKLREGQYDVVFTDLEMPRMHGYDLIREIRYIPSYRHLPIAVVSSRSGQKHRDQAQALGATAYITKPFTPEMLKSILDQSPTHTPDEPLLEDSSRMPESEAPP